MPQTSAAAAAADSVVAVAAVAAAEGWRTVNPQAVAACVVAAGGADLGDVVLRDGTSG